MRHGSSMSRWNPGPAPSQCSSNGTESVSPTSSSVPPPAVPSFVPASIGSARRASIALVLRIEPSVVWFQGALAWRAFARYAEWRLSGKVEWGAQELTIGDACVFVTPNPSPANAAFSLPVLVRWFDALADFLPPLRHPVRGAG